MKKVWHNRDMNKQVERINTTGLARMTVETLEKIGPMFGYCYPMSGDELARYKRALENK